MTQSGLLEHEQEIGLVFSAIEGFHELVALGIATYIGIVAGGNVISTQFEREIQKRFKLDFTITEHVGIGRASSLILCQEISEHPVPVLACKIDAAQRYLKAIGHALRVGQILRSRAVADLIVFFPVLHE